LLKTKALITLLLISVVIVASLVMSCSAAAPVAQYTIRFGAFAAQDCLSYFVMADQGFAQKNGIQFTDIAVSGGPVAIEAIIAGSMDACIAGTVPIITAAQNGVIPGKVVPVAAASFSDPEHQNAGVLISKSIKNWQDLNGQILAASSATGISATALKGRLKIEGVSGYKFIEVPLANLGLAVSGGNVVAAVIPEPYLTQSILRGDGNLLDWVIGGKPFPQMQNSDLVFSAALYQGNPAAAKSLLRAFLAAAKWINQNPDAARTILSKRLSLTAEVAQKMKLIRCPADGRNDPVLLDSMQSVMIDIGMLKAPIPAKQLYDEALLNEVLSEKR
jgi:NitT/TauT family transport system substrate-binding protein